MATVTLEHVSKVYQSKKGDVRAVDDLSLQVANREFVVLVGPSGCGKTTTLRLVAGLEEIDGGTIRIGSRVVNRVAPRDRDIAMVFQNYALYPHMTVFKNLAFGLKMRRVPKDERARRVHEVASLLGITDLLHRKPAALSGGEQQRVAVGRAIVRRPQVFLFDEPLSNLDARLRVQMRAELKSLHRDLQTTILYVTHDQEEAMTLGDRLVIMNRGVVQQCGAPLDVYDRPASRFVAEFIGTPPMNFLGGRLEDGNGTAVFTGGSERLAFPHSLASVFRPHLGQAVTLGIRPEHLRIETARQHARDHAGPDHPSSKDSQLAATVTMLEPLGNVVNVHLVSLGGGTMIARVPPIIPISPGQKVNLTVDMARAHIFTADDAGLRLN